MVPAFCRRRLATQVFPRPRTRASTTGIGHGRGSPPRGTTGGPPRGPWVRACWGCPPSRPRRPRRRPTRPGSRPMARADVFVAARMRSGGSAYGPLVIGPTRAIRVGGFVRPEIARAVEAVVASSEPAGEIEQWVEKLAGQIDGSLVVGLADASLSMTGRTLTIVAAQRREAIHLSAADAQRAVAFLAARRPPNAGSTATRSRSNETWRWTGDQRKQVNQVASFPRGNKRSSVRPRRDRCSLGDYDSSGRPSVRDHRELHPIARQPGRVSHLEPHHVGAGHVGCEPWGGGGV